MVAKNDAEKCCYCGGCVGACPVLALELRETRLSIYEEKCTNCGICVKICPVGAMSLE
tara:strand:- start:7213 stop:7386 length:174 start_codon:yes stop_codon:yes gene_type:complete